MTQTRHSYTVMEATGHIGKVVTELLLQIGNQVRGIGLLALSLTAVLAFLLGCARAAEKEAGTQASDTTTIEARVAARDSAPSPSAKPPAFPPPFHTESAVRFPKIIGWPEGKTPAAPTGFQVSVYAGGLNHPRWLYVLPNGDVLVAESNTEKLGGEMPEPVRKAMEGAGLMGPSANRITLVRDANGDGKPEVHETFLAGLNQPFGMQLLGDWLYVANTDALVRFPYREGQTKITVKGEKVLDLPAGGYNNHWTRNVVASPDGSKLYVSVGSQTNVDEEGLDAKEPRRAAILEVDPDGSGMRIFASGLRNPNGMDWAPGTRVLWTVVNERDALGDDLVPDYLTSVREGAFYGWPYSYFGQNEDPRKKGERPDRVAKAVVPDLAIGAHTASMGLTFYDASAFPQRYRGGAFIGQHGSWNRSRFAGYEVIFVPFQAGRPSGPPEDFLTGFIADEAKSEVYGRPVGLAVLPDGSLLVADDGGNVVWRVTYAGSGTAASR
jgi:glucose/arabinose dehydrogenase